MSAPGTAVLESLSETFMVIVCSSPGCRGLLVKCKETDNTFGGSTTEAADGLEETNFVAEAFNFETGLVVAVVVAAELVVAFEETGLVV
jgi:hypothetical protein